MTRLPGDDVLSCVSPFHQPKVSASRRQEWQADQGLKWHRATVDSARPACVHASVVRHVSPCITRMWLRPLDCDVDVASQCLLTLLTSTKHRPINHQSINQCIYIAQRQNVSNALKRRVNTEQIKKRFNVTFEDINGKGGIAKVIEYSIGTV